ncbi:VWA domain-containing protein [Congregibacter sp.]|uniref:VWA domain-containing protein n=1 Tax=Congregibacter sp. TaxID=2744308 RepID=UPI003F6BCB75
MQSSLLRFVEILRSHALPVSPAETLDAAAAMEVVGYDDRDSLRNALAMTLAKSDREEHTFFYCFDQFFDQQAADFSTDRNSEGAYEATDSDHGGTDSAAENSPEMAGSGAGQAAGGGGSATDAAELAAAAGNSPALQELLDGELLPALLENQRGTLSTAMRRAGQDAGISNIRLFTQKGQYTRKILDSLGENLIRDAVIELERAESLAIDTLRRYRDVLREQVRDYVEQQYLMNAEGHNSAFMEDVLSKTRLSNIDRRHRDRVQAQVRRMARRLASRHSARRRPVKRGQLNMGKTLRGGMAHDGILFKTHWRSRKRDKAQLLAVCDVSGSVAAYASFLLMFLYSLQDVLPRTRSFAFSSHLGEISDLFRDEPLERAIELANWRYGGATDYGSSLRDFSRLALDDINRNTSVIILGDARNNRGDPELEIMQSIYERSKQLIWLNPESRRAWGTGDSEMLRYQTACHYCAPCSNLQQLERVVDQLLKSLR